MLRKLNMHLTELNGGNKRFQLIAKIEKTGDEENERTYLCVYTRGRDGKFVAVKRYRLGIQGSEEKINKYIDLVSRMVLDMRLYNEQCPRIIVKKKFLEIRRKK